MLQDRMTDLTRTRGPTVLSKRARHRIAPRLLHKPEPLKQMSHFPTKDFVGKLKLLQIEFDN